MSFKNLKIQDEYRTLEKDIVKNFLNPVMSEAVLYERAVGFFSSTALACYTKGLDKLIENGGEVYIVASPKLMDDDREAISLGYKLLDEVVEKRLEEGLLEPVNSFDAERLNRLAYYIANNKIHLKIAFVLESDGTIDETGKTIHIYHEKLGLFKDIDGNWISFGGSMNESANGFSGNYETVDVFCDWKEPDRVMMKRTAFDNIWNSTAPNIVVKSYPNIEKKIIERFRTKEEPIFDIDDKELEEKDNAEKKWRITLEYDALYPYQLVAVNNWKNAGYKGCMTLCTGAGKTYCGIAAIKRAYEDNKRLFVVITVPYQHLVEQWVEDLCKFNIEPIIGYGDRKYKDYKEKLTSARFRYNIDVEKFVCFICTNATFKTGFVQKQLEMVSGNIMILSDEAHNMGTPQLRKMLKPFYDFRLALSATIERHGDEEGTHDLLDFFGDICAEYSIEDAINENRLTHYMYHPIIVFLNQNELEKYKELSAEIGQHCRVNKYNELIMDETAKKLAIERARLLAGAINIIPKLLQIMETYKNDNNMLIYCGAATLSRTDIQDIDDNFIEDDIRQIDYVSKKLYEVYGIRSAQFTSRETSEQREIIKNEFAQADLLQALVAIKCLDEGVNIPGIKTAFILASSTNPKEYIQRRGRVLRTAPGKERATIFDFVVLPHDIRRLSLVSPDELKKETSTIINEVTRMYEFKKIADNPQETDIIINELMSVYGLTIEDGKVKRIGGELYE